MTHCKDNQTKPLFYSSFDQMVLELNGIKPKEEDLMGAPICIDESVVSKMRCDTYSDGIFYYLEKSVRKVYDDKVVESRKKAIVTAIASNIRTSCSYFASVIVKVLLDDMLQKLLADNHVMEDVIIAHINVNTRDSEDNRSMIKAEVKEDIQGANGCMTTQIQALKTTIDYLCVMHKMPQFQIQKTLMATPTIIEELMVQKELRVMLKSFNGYGQTQY
ncbi:hypothetical protein RYX36_035065 [Vicia faba]